MYSKRYDNNQIRNNDYSVINYIQEYYKKDFICLDLGCGNCRKIIPLANKVKYYYAIDYNKKRIIDARKKCSGISNISLGVADNFYLPFGNDSIDLVSCFMTKFNIGEVSRVLKGSGVFIIETLGANDKKDFKKAFGMDELGWRGRLLSNSIDNQIACLKKSLEPFFIIEKLLCLEFITFIKRKMLIELFKMTNDVRDFLKKDDLRIIKSFQNKEGFIKINEERIIIIAKKI